MIFGENFAFVYLGYSLKNSTQPIRRRESSGCGRDCLCPPSAFQITPQTAIADNGSRLADAAGAKRRRFERSGECRVAGQAAVKRLVQLGVGCGFAGGWQGQRSTGLSSESYP